MRGKRCPGRRKGEEELEARELLFLMLYLDEGAASFLGGGGGGGGGACVLRIRVSQTGAPSTAELGGRPSMVRGQRGTHIPVCAVNR